MTNEVPRPTAALLREIGASMQPVEPVPIASQLALRLAPLAIAAATAIVLWIGLRRDAAALGPAITWGGSFLLLWLGWALLWIAARESTLSKRLPRIAVHSALVSAWIVLAVIAWWTLHVSPPMVLSRAVLWRLGLYCALGGGISGALLVAAITWSFRGSLTARPALAGAVYGTGAGLIVNAGWRLVCQAAEPWHLLAHGVAVASAALFGAVAAHLMARRIWRPRPNSAGPSPGD